MTMDPRRIARKMLLAVTLASLGCTPRPPAAPVPTPEIRVAASLGRTWDATIDHFAETSIPIRTLERVSGIIVTDPLHIPFDSPETQEAAYLMADCGTDMLRTRGWPTHVTYNVRVLGDSTASSLRITAFFVKIFGSGPAAISRRPDETCSTKGVLERRVQAAIKARAERR